MLQWSALLDLLGKPIQPSHQVEQHAAGLAGEVVVEVGAAVEERCKIT
jgi:hypothetical protein